MRCKTNLVEKTVLALRMPYKLTKEQQEKAKKIYETNPYDTMRYREKKAGKTPTDK